MCFDKNMEFSKISLFHQTVNSWIEDMEKSIGNKLEGKVYSIQIFYPFLAKFKVLQELALLHVKVPKIILW